MQEAEQALRDCLRVATRGLAATMLALAVLDEARTEAMRYWPAAGFLGSLPELACREDSPAVAFLRNALAVDPGARSAEVDKVLSLVTGEETSAIAAAAKPRENCYGTL